MTTIGETESGRSSSALTIRLPGNSLRTSSRETPTPNTVLMAVATTAAIAVSRNAECMSGSSRIARMASSPVANVFVTTSDTGQATSRNR